MTDIRWRGIDHRQLYEWINSGEGARASTPQLQYWGQLKESIADIHTTLTDRLSKLGVEWQGTAGETAQSGVNPLQQWAEEVQSNIDSMGRVAQNQADLVATARAAMPEPVPVQTPQPTAWASAQAAQAAQAGNPGPAAAIAAQAADFEAQEATAADAQERAIQVMSTYENNSEANRGGLAAFEEPQPVGVEVTGPAGTTTSIGYKPTSGQVLPGEPAGVTPSGLALEGAGQVTEIQQGVPAGDAGVPGSSGDAIRAGRPLFIGTEPGPVESGGLRFSGQALPGAVAGGIGLGAAIGGRGSARSGKADGESTDPLQGPMEDAGQGEVHHDAVDQVGSGVASGHAGDAPHFGPTGSGTVAAQSQQPLPGQQTGAVQMDPSQQHIQPDLGQPQVQPTQGGQTGTMGTNLSQGAPGQPGQSGVTPAATPVSGAGAGSGVSGNPDLVRGQSPLMRGAAGGYQGFSGQGMLGSFGGSTHSASASDGYDSGGVSSDPSPIAGSGAVELPNDRYEDLSQPPSTGTEASFEDSRFSEEVSDAESIWGDDRTVAPPVLGEDFER